MNLKKLTTENRNPNTFNLDEMSSLEIVTTMNQEDYRVPKGIETELKSISELVDAVVNAIENGGRLIYMGAGTSGRLGVLDASECPPTYGVDPSLVVGLIAGGDKALRLPLENVEDKQELGVEDLKNINLTSKDVVLVMSILIESLFDICIIGAPLNIETLYFWLCLGLVTSHEKNIN